MDYKRIDHREIVKDRVNELLRTGQIRTLGVGGGSGGHGPAIDPNGGAASGSLMKIVDYGFEDIRVTLETRYAASSDYSTSTFNFKFRDGINETTTTGEVGIHVPLKNIVEIEVEPFEIPNSISSNDYIDTTYFTNHFKDLLLLIKELHNESIKNVSANHHFEFQTTISGKYISLNPNHNKIILRGTKLEEITLQFLYENYPLNLKEGRYNNVAVHYENPMRLVFPSDHFMSDEDNITFENFSGSSDDTKFINTPYGHVVAVTNATTVTLPNVNAIADSGPATATVFIKNRNIRIPLRFRTLTFGNPTNYIFPTA